jgi:hypothetical protein
MDIVLGKRKHIQAQTVFIYVAGGFKACQEKRVEQTQAYLQSKDLFFRRPEYTISSP